MIRTHSLALQLSSVLLIIVQAQYKHPIEATPRHFDEEWSHYDKCHFFDPRNRFWEYHHCEYVDCSYYAPTCAESVYGRWPVMTTRYSDGCVNVHIRVPRAPSTSCWPGKTMTMCCTYKNDPSRIVTVKPFHQRNETDPEFYWPYPRQYDTRVTWSPERPRVPTYPTPEPDL